jgi:soluble cytochrome b562
MKHTIEELRNMAGAINEAIYSLETSYNNEDEEMKESFKWNIEQLDKTLELLQELINKQ